MREMKESNILGVGKIPNEWSCRRVKFLLSGLTDGTHGTYERVKEGYPLLSAKNVFEDGIRIGDNESQISKEDYDSIIANGYPQKGDILLCCVGTVGRCTIYQEEKPYAFQRSIVFMRPNKDISSEMLKYAMQCDSTLAQETVLVNQAAQAGLYQGAVRELRIPLPLDFEQQQIVAYLDAKCDAIDKAIAHKRSVIEKLKEYRTAAIFKEIKSIKDLSVKKVKFIFHVYSGATPKSSNLAYWDGNIVWATPADYKTEDKFINDSGKHITEEGYNSCATHLVPKGSIIIAKRAPIGTTAIANVPLCTNQGCLACVPKNDIVSDFYYYVFSAWNQNMNKRGQGTTFQEIPFKMFVNMKIPFCSKQEQNRIAVILNKKCFKIDSAIQQQEQIIAKLEEYRKSVIYYAVTGKIDCRKAV